MKIGILTFHCAHNYGAVLQCYALQETLKGMGHEVEVIDYRPEFLLSPYEVWNIRRYGSYNSFLKRLMLECLTLSRGIVRHKAFDLFIQARLCLTKEKTISSSFDAYIIGSDQVWNPNFGRMSDIDFLTFVPENKRNSMAASFGVSNIKPEMEQYYKERLSKFNNISVREDSGKKIVEELTGRTDVEVLVDPTMLLTPEEWDKVSKKPEQLNFNKYILCYFLGELSEQRKKEIERVAKENDCKIINILDKKDPFYETGPSEFLYLEKNAFLICTDSFH